MEKSLSFEEFVNEETAPFVIQGEQEQEDCCEGCYAELFEDNQYVNKCPKESGWVRTDSMSIIWLN